MIRSTLNRWFLKIQEPRNVRIAMLVAYLWTIGTGYVALTQNPDQFFIATGPRIVFSIAGFLIIGGAFGAYAVLPGLWWLEKIGIVSIAFGLLCRGILIIAINGSAEAFSILTLTVIMFAVRWITIRRADLAPLAG